MVQQSRFWMYTPKMKIESQRDVCSLLFIAALFPITKIRKQPKCLPVGAWIKTCAIYLHTYVMNKEYVKYMYICIHK